MEASVEHAPLPASIHDVAAVLIVRHLDHHLPEVVVRCLFDSYERVGGHGPWKGPPAERRGSPAASRLHTRPPPKQKPMAASFTPGSRRASSSIPERMSATKRVSGTFASAAVAFAGTPSEAVPPSSESRSGASAEKPSAASRATIE